MEISEVEKSSDDGTDINTRGFLRDILEGVMGKKRGKKSPD